MARGIRVKSVALHLLNCPQYTIAYLAALKLGAVLTPISPVYTSSEVKHQLTDSGAKIMVSGHPL